MCNATCIIFGIRNLTSEEIIGKRIIEVGSYDVNGSLRSIIESSNPAEYIGVDIQKGRGVDIVCNAEDIINKFGKESFDVVISTELLEHVRNWKKVVSNIKNICKPNGIILITTRSYGHGYHAYPTDFWRYEFLDLKYIFSDCLIEILKKDYSTPGVFMKAKKPKYFIENNLSNYLLYSIIDDRRVKYIEEKRLKDFLRKYEIKETVKRYLKKIFRFLFH